MVTPPWYDLRTLCLGLLRKRKAVPLQAWSGPEGSKKLRSPDFMTTAQNGGMVVSLTHRQPSPPGSTPGTHFCQRLSRTQGHSATARIMSLKISNDNIGNRTRDLSCLLHERCQKSSRLILHREILAVLYDSLWVSRWIIRLLIHELSTLL
jgi:hypothetical protein